VRDRDDTGEAEHEIVARDQDNKNADARGYVERLGAGKQKGREQKHGQNE
jgi:hypothetical protein